MTGICYYKNADGFILNEQLDSIVDNNDDDSLLIEQSSQFSPLSADELIQEAINKKCDNLIFLTEDKNVNLLSELIPQEYGNQFKNIQVLSENFIRYNEATPIQQTTVVQPQQQVQTQVVKQSQQPQQQRLKESIIFICNAAAPNVAMMQSFSKFLHDVKSNPKLINIDTLEGKDVKVWFTNMQDAGLTASGVKTLYLQYPNGIYKDSALSNLGFTDDGWDGNIDDVVAKVMVSKAYQSRITTTFVVPASLAPNVPGEASKLIKIIKAKYDWKNKNNAEIMKCIIELAKDSKDNFANVPKRSDIKQGSEEFNRQLNNDKEKVQYIATYVQLYQWYEKHKNEVRVSKEAESELAKAIKEWLAQGLELEAWKGKAKDMGLGIFISGAEKLSKALKNDMKHTSPEKDRDEKQNGNKLVNVFMYHNYKKLCEMLFGK